MKRYARLSCFLTLVATLLLPALLRAEEKPTSAVPKGSKDVVVMVKVIDKVAAQPHSLHISVGAVGEFSTLSILPKRCSVNDQGQFAALLEIYDQPPTGGAVQLFSGWMFSESPSLSYIEHPFYDVSLERCMPREEKKAETKKAASATHSTH